MSIRRRAHQFHWRGRLCVTFVLALLLGLLPQPRASAATPVFRQATGKEINSGRVNSLAFNSANVAGNLIVVSLLWSNTSGVAMTDSRGNTYVAATVRTTWSGSWSAQTFYAKNIAGGANTVTATFASTISSFGIVQIHEYSGLDKSNPLDGGAVAAGSGTAMSSGGFTTTASGDMVFGAGGSVGNMNSLGAGFTQRLNTFGNKTMDKVAGGAGSYSATATNSGGAWVMQAIALKSDQGLDVTAPSAPTSLSASTASSTRIDLSWAASTDNVGVTGYDIERCQGAGCTNFGLAATASATSHSDTGLSPSTAYRYRVRAKDAAGNVSGYSNVVVSSTANPPDAVAPTVPTGLQGTGASVSQINLIWSVSTDNVGVTGYRVFRNGVDVGTRAAPSFQDTGLTVDTSYAYAVSAYDAAGNNSAQSSSVNVRTLRDTTPPSVPTGLTPRIDSSTQITLSWNASTDDVGVARYRLFRDSALLTDSAVSPQRDAGLAPGTTYRYTLTAVDAAGNESAPTAPVPATTPAIDTTAPSATMTAPAQASTVSGTISVSATANDNIGVAGVQFLLDGVNIGAEDATVPYSISWDSTTTSNGLHALSARARDTAGNLGATSGVVNVSVSNASAPPLPPDLMAGWGFNEATGTSSADLSGNGNTATLQNNPAWVSGKYGTGVKFDHIDDFLTVLNSPTMNITGNSLTISMWINPLGGTGDQELLGKFWNANMTSPYYQYAIELQSNGSVPVLLVGSAAGLTSVSMGSALPIGQWSHLAITFNGSVAAFYRNGSLVTSAPLSVSLSARDSLFYMGADVSNSQFLNATLDDLRIYRRALDQAQIQADMGTPLSAPANPSAPTVTLTAPTNGSQVGGIAVVTADADDDTGVAGVQFFVDGEALGPEDTATPFAANWDTRVTTNGAHTVTARARDVTGNVKTSAPVTVNVANSDYFQNEVLAAGFDLPTAMKFLPDGRMLVAELRGKIRVVPPPYTTPEAALFLQITNLGTVNLVQQGIFDFALDPDFAVNHYYYVFYTAKIADGTDHDRLSRFTANATATGTIPGSELVLYEDPFVANDEHHGGAVNFANDGKILFTTGEHFASFPSQDLSNPRGKVHRINKDGTVPTDNPFYDGSGPHWDSVWALGLRNPYRAFYDGPTGRLLIGDVGGNVGNSYEELDVGAPAANFGWPDTEGPCSGNCTSPLYSYNHNSRDAAITGGFVYHGTQFPSSMNGNYFFGDYAQNWIKRMTFNADGTVAGVFNFEPLSGALDGPTGDVVYLTEGPDQALYYLDLGYSDVSGTFGVSKVRRIRYLQSNQAPVSVVSATPTSGFAPLTVSFSSVGSNDPEGQPITYQWDFGDGALSSGANPSHTYTTSGQYLARLMVSDGVNSTYSTPITVSVGSAPTASIASPVDGSTFRAGDVISFAGTATDAEDGVLPASAYTWNIDFLHDGHVHPGPVLTGVKNGTFTIPTSGHDFSGNTRYRIGLTVTDTSGLTDTRSVTIWPQKVNLTFDTAPTGLTLYVDGIARVAPFTYDTLAGFSHTIEARNQSVSGTNYAFASWSDGGAQLHTITVSTVPQPYLANYTAPQGSPGLVGAWGFNEGAGTSSADASGNNNQATLLNGVAWASGVHGSGLGFDGANDYLTMPGSSSLNVAGTALTLSMWLNPSTSGGGDQVVIGKPWNTTMTSPYYQYGLELQANGTVPHFFVGTAGGVLEASMGTALAKGQWTHLAIVFDGSQVRFYVAGVLVSTTGLSASITGRNQLLRVGADASSQQLYKGLLDDLRIYAKARTPIEVQADMTTGV
jgi:glucose/arabinose dehydrogenase/PKD repeat protein/fibronectin type 3 domain-containing protein